MQYPAAITQHAPCEPDHEETDSFHVEYATDDVAVVTYEVNGEVHRVVLSLAA